MREFTVADVARAIERLRAPLPGGKIEAALSFGVDLTLLAEQIRLTPAERAARMHTLCCNAEAVRGVARKTAT